MRAQESGWNWNIERPYGEPYSGKGWATDFTCFRFAVPELCEFQGRAIYVDTDMIFLSDPAELWNTKTRKAWECAGMRTDVSVINCSDFLGAEWWPSIMQMRASGSGLRRYIDILKTNGFMGHGISPDWDCMDGRGYRPGSTKLIHYTDMRTQPWFPYPKVFDYTQPHINPLVCKIWNKYHKEAKAQGVTV